MKITVHIKERPNGDVEVHIKNEAGFVTTREDKLADAITKSIKAHLAREMPAICKKILANESGPFQN